jgi:adenosine 3'-phospho 5'-phosphosulfate transporter B3
MLLLSLCADALLGNWQERTMHESAMSSPVMLVLQSGFASAFSLLIAASLGELPPGLALLSSGPNASSLCALIGIYGAVMLGGTSCVLSLVNEYGAASAVLVTLLRKCLSMLASYVLWPKALTAAHLLGALLVLGSPYVSQVLGLPSSVKKAAPPPDPEEAR